MTSGKDKYSSIFERWQRLAAQSQAGDRQAYESLLQELYPFFQDLFSKKLRGVVDADDVTQESLIAVHRSLASYDTRRSIKPWLYAIARFKIVDHFRRVSRRKEQALPDNLADVTKAEGGANSMEKGETLAHLQEAIGRLPESLREAIQLTKVEGLSYAEASRRVGVAEPALRKRISRAYKSLGDLFSQSLEKDSAEE